MADKYNTDGTISRKGDYGYGADGTTIPMDGPAGAQNGTTAHNPNVKSSATGK